VLQALWRVSHNLLVQTHRTAYCWLCVVSIDASGADGQSMQRGVVEGCCVVIEATMEAGREMVGKRVDYALKII
jgi:hypothetical protein